MSDDITVRITLRRGIAERLRATCHARGETASQLVDRWILAHDERGDPPAQAQPQREDALMDRIFGALRGPR